MAQKPHIITFEDGPFKGESIIASGDKNSPILNFTRGGKTYTTNLFRLQAQEGIPLDLSIALCVERGWVPCLQQYVADAMAEWASNNSGGDRAAQRAKVVRLVQVACSEAQYTPAVPVE